MHEICHKQLMSLIIIGKSSFMVLFQVALKFGLGSDHNMDNILKSFSAENKKNLVLKIKIILLNFLLRELYF